MNFSRPIDADEQADEEQEIKDTKYPMKKQTSEMGKFSEISLPKVQDINPDKNANLDPASWNFSQ